MLLKLGVDGGRRMQLSTFEIQQLDWELKYLRLQNCFSRHPLFQDSYLLLFKVSGGCLFYHLFICLFIYLFKEMVRVAVQSVPCIEPAELLRNVVVNGDAANIKSFVPRLQKELQAIFPSVQGKKKK